jgi:hypothetical protein
MVHLACSIFKRRGDIRIFKIGIIFQDLGATRPASKHFEDIGHADTHTAYAGPTTTLGGIKGDALSLIIHRLFACSGYDSDSRPVSGVNDSVAVPRPPNLRRRTPGEEVTESDQANLSDSRPDEIARRADRAVWHTG